MDQSGVFSNFEVLAESMRLPSLPSDSWAQKSCCGALYELEPVRLLLGDTLHPGGLALTHRLGKLMGIERGQRVLDIACGRGTSTTAVARSFHCRTIGVDLGRGGLVEAARLVGESHLESSVSLNIGDAEMLPLACDCLDAALCECSFSTFPDKRLGLAEVGRVLRDGGRLGVSDFTVRSGSLLLELGGTLGQMLCIAGAPSVEGYQELFTNDGFNLVHQENASGYLAKLLSEIETKVAAFRVFQSYGSQSPEVSDFLPKALSLLGQVKALVADGSIGYWLFVAEKTPRG